MANQNRKTPANFLKWWQDHRHLPQEQAHFFSKLERWREQMISVEKQNLKNALRRLYAQEETQWNRKKASYVRTKAIDLRAKENAQDMQWKAHADKTDQPVVILPAILRNLNEEHGAQPSEVMSAESIYTPPAVSNSFTMSNEHGHTLKEVLDATNRTQANGVVSTSPDIVVSRLTGTSKSLPPIKIRAGLDDALEKDCANSIGSIDHTVMSQQQRLQKALNAQTPAEEYAAKYTCTAREQELYRGSTVGRRVTPPSNNALHLFVLPSTCGHDWGNGSLHELDEQVATDRGYTVPVSSPVGWGSVTPKENGKIRLLRNMDARNARMVSPLNNDGDRGVRYMAQPPEPFAVAGCLMYPARARLCRLTPTNYREYRDGRPSKNAKTKKHALGGSVKLPQIAQKKEPSPMEEFRRSVASFYRPSRERTIDSVESSYNQLEANTRRRKFGSVELSRLQESMKVLDHACEVGLNKTT